MASFILIHGAWHDGACYDRLRAPLEAAGHALATPTLPGMGGDTKALAAVTLDGWAQFIVALAEQLDGPIILGGHSRAGIVVSRAAELASHLFQSLVYIAAALVPDGMTHYEVIGAKLERRSLGTAITAVADGFGLSLAADRAVRVFYNRCAPDDQAHAARLLVEPVRPMGTVLELSDARFGRLPRHYIECADDKCLPLADQRAMQQALPCVTVTTLDSDHSPFFCVPDQLAAALINIADRREI